MWFRQKQIDPLVKDALEKTRRVGALRRRPYTCSDQEMAAARAEWLMACHEVGVATVFRHLREDELEEWAGYR